MQILGIVNITRDSFSDGGLYFDPEEAVQRALQLVADGAAYVDIGAESTHPDAEAVSDEDEVARVSGVLRVLKVNKVCVSVDTYKPLTARAALALGADMINDVSGGRDADLARAIADSDAQYLIMHATADTPKAQRTPVSADGMLDRVLRFFEERIAKLQNWGVRREQLILDPGLGLFLSTDPNASVNVLRGIERLKELGPPVCIAASRKSFIGALLAPAGADPRPVYDRAYGTLAVELWAALSGAEYIRTHDVRAAADALRLLSTLTERPDIAPQPGMHAAQRNGR